MVVLDGLSIGEESTTSAMILNEKLTFAEALTSIPAYAYIRDTEEQARAYHRPLESDRADAECGHRQRYFWAPRHHHPATGAARAVGLPGGCRRRRRHHGLFRRGRVAIS